MAGQNILFRCISAVAIALLLIVVLPPLSVAAATDAHGSSNLVTWTCTSGPCPWGSSLTGHAIEWPSSTSPTAQRLGYTVDAGIYLPATAANGTTITITSGFASAYAGDPQAGSHRYLGSIAAGDDLDITGLAPNEVLSIQDYYPFDYTIGEGGGGEPDSCTDPTTCDVVDSVQGRWRCDLPGCTAADWVTAIIAWPAWSAYPNNARSGTNSRTVYSADGDVLHPYMGAWADGCSVTAETGMVLIIEWERGTDVWRETWLSAGETHVISLTSPEDGAMIESFDFSPGFSASLENCTPQPLP